MLEFTSGVCFSLPRLELFLLISVWGWFLPKPQPSPLQRKDACSSLSLSWKPATDTPYSSAWVAGSPSQACSSLSPLNPILVGEEGQANWQSLCRACIFSEWASACVRKPTHFYQRMHCQQFKNRPMFWLWEGERNRGGPGSWMEPPFVLWINAFAENSWVTLMRGEVQMVKWAGLPSLGESHLIVPNIWIFAFCPLSGDCPQEHLVMLVGGSLPCFPPQPRWPDISASYCSRGMGLQ